MKKLQILVYLLCLAPKLLSAYPQRIVSTTVASDEILLELLDDKSEVKRIIAVSKFALSKRYSHIKKLPPHIKYQIATNVEFLVKLKPDLVVITSFSNPNKKAMLKRFKIPFYEMKSFDNIEGIEEEILELGKIIGKSEKAKLMVGNMRRRLRNIKGFSKKPSLLSYSSSSSLLGSKTLFNDIVLKAGATNLASDKGVLRWKKVSSEFLMSLEPDFIVTDESTSMTFSTVWKNKKAVQLNNIIKVPSNDLLSTSQYIVNAVEKMNREIRLKIKAK